MGRELLVAFLWRVLLNLMALGWFWHDTCQNGPRLFLEVNALLKIGVPVERDRQL